MTKEIKDFDYWKNAYNSDKLDEFNFNSSALLWLKIKSITRKELLSDFIQSNSLIIKSKLLNDRFKEIYSVFIKDLEKSHLILDKFINDKNQENLHKSRKKIYERFL